MFRVAGLGVVVLGWALWSGGAGAKGLSQLETPAYPNPAIYKYNEESPYFGKDAKLEIWVDISPKVQRLAYRIFVDGQVETQKTWHISSGRNFRHFRVCTDNGNPTRKKTTVGEYTISLDRMFPVWESLSYGKTQVVNDLMSPDDAVGAVEVIEGEGAKMKWAIGHNAKNGEYLHQVVDNSSIPLLGYTASGGCIRNAPERAEELYARILQVSPEKTRIMVINSSESQDTLPVPVTELAEPRAKRRPTQYIELNVSCLQPEERVSSCAAAAEYISQSMYRRDSKYYLQSLLNLDRQCQAGLIRAQISKYIKPEYLEKAEYGTLVSQFTQSGVEDVSSTDSEESASLDTGERNWGSNEEQVNRTPSKHQVRVARSYPPYSREILAGYCYVGESGCIPRGVPLRRNLFYNGRFFYKVGPKEYAVSYTVRELRNMGHTW